MFFTALQKTLVHCQVNPTGTLAACQAALMCVAA